MLPHTDDDGKVTCHGESPPYRGCIGGRPSQTVIHERGGGLIWIKRSAALQAAGLREVVGLAVYDRLLEVARHGGLRLLPGHVQAALVPQWLAALLKVELHAPPAVFCARRCADSPPAL